AIAWKITRGKSQIEGHRSARFTNWRPLYKMRGLMNSIVNIAAYKFLPLDDLKRRRVRLQGLCREAGLKGSILLSQEGINLFVAGREPQIELLLSELRAWPGLADLQPKFS